MEKRKKRDMEIARKKFQGVLNILSFNRHFYFIGLGVLLIIGLCFLYYDWPNYLLWLILFSFSYGLIIPLVVSAYVYDYSGYYEFNWLDEDSQRDSESLDIVNINAGFDETSFILKKRFPKSNLKVFDFYDSKTHTEPAIVRARKVSLFYPNTKEIKSDRIPLKSNSTDIVFLLSAAHEIRKQKEKIGFLKECRRVCKEDGKVIMVEHLRDLPNFLAFTVGFTHFFSKTTWLGAFKASGFRKVEEIKFTPFMSIFTCNP